jgi:hypothetical protein
VDLQRDDTGVLDALFRLDPDGGALAVDEEKDLRAVRHDLVAVPLAGLFEPRDEVRVGHREHLVPARLVVKAARIARADVRLVAGHFVGRVRDALAAELHAAVHEALCADELVFEAQVKVPVALARGEELIARIPLQRSAHDDAIADAPDLVRLPLPPGERLAVEEWDGGGAQVRNVSERGKD